MKQHIQIGVLASRIGVQPEAIRYYERRGLLPQPKRGPNGYRIYTGEHLDRVEFIKKAQALGLSLEEIREVMELKFSGTSPCQHVRDLLHEKLESVEQQISRLQDFRRDLLQYLESCEKALKVHRATRETCPTLERIQLQPAGGGRKS